MNNTDPRQIRSMRNLRNAYLSLVEKEANLTIQLLCKEAKVTRPTFYKYFSTIENLKTYVHEYYVDQLKEALLQTNELNVDRNKSNEDSTWIPTNIFQHIQEQHYVYDILLMKCPDVLFITKIKQTLSSFIPTNSNSSGIHHTIMDANLEFIQSFYSAAFVESIRWWIKHEFEPSPEEMASLVVKTAILGQTVDRMNS